MIKKLTAPGVVAGWGVGLLILTAIHAGYGAQRFVLSLFAGAGGVILVTAGLVLASRRRRPGPPERFMVPRSTTPSILVAFAVWCLGEGIIFGSWTMLLAPVPVAAAIWMVVADHRRRQTTR